MIRYTLKCTEYHEFESWFQSADAFDKLRKVDLITCPRCGTTDVNKAIMAPRVRPSRDAAPAPNAETPTPASAPETNNVEMHALTAPSSPAEAAMIELKKKIQDNSEYVGANFATEARKIHDGDAPERSIYGEASGDEAKKLVDDGVPVAPLPFIPTRKSN